MLIVGTLVSGNINFSMSSSCVKSVIVNVTPILDAIFEK